MEKTSQTMEERFDGLFETLKRLQPKYHETVKDFFLQEISLAEKVAWNLGIEEALKIVKDRKPILYNEDTNRYLENVAKWNVLAEIEVLLNKLIKE